MNNKVRFFALIFLTFSLLECIDSKLFAFIIPGVPFTLGRLSFVISGVIGIFEKDLLHKSSNIFKAFCFIYFGAIIGAAFSNDFADNFSRTIGMLLLFFGAAGVANFWHTKQFRRLLDIFFITLLSYWSLKTYVKTIFNIGFTSYAELFSEGEAINHHVPGILMSVSCAYLSLRFFFKGNRLKLGGYILFGNTLLSCLLIESRSNFLFTAIIMLVILFKEKKDVRRVMFITIPILLMGYFVIEKVAMKNSAIEQRFNIQDSEYQERTTGMRFDFIEAAFASFFSDPFGKGVKRAEVVYKGKTTMLHNQYLTFILSGGIVALIGVIILLRSTYSLFRGVSSRYKQVKPYSFFVASNIAVVTFFLTLFTIEFSGMMSFIITSLAIFSSAKITRHLAYFRFINKRNKILNDFAPGRNITN